jgi:alcohol dehydrogenase
MDSAKAASILSKNPGAPEDYFVGGKKKFTAPGMPVIAIPTTAGTGSEVSGAAVVKTRDEIKAFYDHLWMRPVVAIVDPLMSATMPQKLTASTGMDALSHAVESSLTNAANLMTRTFAMKSIQLITNNLRLAVYQGDNITARYNMAMAASIGSLSETNAGDLEGHAIAHLLGSLLKLPHGLCCAVMLPYVMEYNRLVSPEVLRDIAHAMGEDVGSLSTMDAARRASRAVKSLVEDVGLPSNIQELGVKESDLPTLADQSLTIPWIKFFFERRSIRKATKESVLQLLQSAWKGQLESG